jgi:hypothetical protein
MRTHHKVFLYPLQMYSQRCYERSAYGQLAVERRTTLSGRAVVSLMLTRHADCSQLAACDGDQLLSLLGRVRRHAPRTALWTSSMTSSQ